MMGHLLATPHALNVATWSIVGLATAGVITRPFRWPEAVWAVSGAAVLVAFGLLPAGEAGRGILKGVDVYLFLVGMMLLSEVARQEGLFDWLAAWATELAKGSATRLFALVYAVGTGVTIFLSNDATAVVLTPAVYAATRAANVSNPLPFLYTCAFIANAASFVLPISNPANLVVNAGHMPPLLDWLKTFGLPSVASIGTTFLVLWWTQRGALAAETIATDVEHPVLASCGRVAAFGILATAALLIGASACGVDLGMPTLVSGTATAAAILVMKRERPAEILRGVSWGVLPLVAGLFVLVEALDRTGMIRLVSDELRRAVAEGPRGAAAGAGLVVAIASNLVNNLPAGLVTASAVHQAGAPNEVAAAILIGVDLGPNLSVTGSLATILWLVALRREDQHVGTWTCLKLGCLVMPPALVLSIGAAILFG